jgi:hypothetical protein
VNPIPEDASARDPRWAVAFLDLAHGLVMAGAKARIIARFTGFPLGTIRKMYKALRGTDPPSGPVMQGSAQFFAMRSKHTSEAWSIQSAIFMACYERVGTITAMKLHRGWQLLAAFTVYKGLTEKLHQATAIKRLDINQAYALLTHCGFMVQPGAVDLARKECPVCLIRYPVALNERLESQRCPVCAMNANSLRLSHQSSPARRQKKPAAKQ